MRRPLLTAAIGAAVTVLCSAPPASAGQADDLRALIEQQRQEISQLAKRVADLEQVLTKPAAGSGGQSREAVTAEASGDILAQPTESAPQAAPAGADPGNLLAGVVQKGAFPRSFLIPGSNVSLRIAGYVRFDGLYDAGTVGSTVRYFPDTIGVSGALDPGVMRLSAGQTRLNFEAQAPRSFGNLRTFVEGDFFGTGDGFHLRHAYGEVGGFLAGYTWTALMDLRALPQTVAFTAPVGAIYRPQAVLRYRHKIANGLAVTVSAENPAADVSTAGTERVLRPMPDIVSNVSYSPGPSRHVQLGGIFRRDGVEATAGSKQYAAAWGLVLTGHIVTIGRDEVRAGGFVGDGIGSYVAGFATSATSAGLTSANQLEALESRGGYVSYQHWWSPLFRSTALWGVASVDNLAPQPASALHETETAGANFIWNPTPGFGIGLEYFWGRRENHNGARGTDPRVQLGIQFGY